MHIDELDETVQYCDYCEQEGHTFRLCPQRDDELPYEDAEVDAYAYEHGATFSEAFGRTDDGYEPPSW